MRSVVFGRSDGDDDEGAQAAMEEWRRRMPPDNEVVGTVAVDTVVTRNEDVAFTLRSLRVMSNGVLLDFVVQHRVDDDPAVGGHPRFPFGGGVLVGVELSDGSTATSFEGAAFGGPGSSAPGGPVLEHRVVAVAAGRTRSPTGSRPYRPGTSSWWRPR